MVVLLIVLVTTIGLAVRAAVYRRGWSVAEADTYDDSGLFETCARTFVLVLLALAGLMALGVVYGNVLGAVHAHP